MVSQLLLITSILTAPHTTEPFTLDERKQLFLDDVVVASMENVARRIHPARKHPKNPLVTPEEELEGKLALVYGSVIEDQGRYRMWYLSRHGVHLAESDDGIHWKKPMLDRVTLDGKKTNIVIPRQSLEGAPHKIPYFYEMFGVFHDDSEPDPAKRYKIGFLSIHRNYQGPRQDPFHRGQRRGLGVATSPDGIEWTLEDAWATEAICDGATHWMFDPERQKYVLYGRTKYLPPEVRDAWKDVPFFDRIWGRAVARVESKNFVDWNYEDPATAPVVMAPDLEDPPGTEIYSMHVLPYGSVYIGFVQVFYNRPDACYLEIQLAVSRDSIHFERVGDRSAFIPVGGVGTWDRFNNSLANSPPIEVDGELRFYYGGRTYRHSPYQGPDRGEIGGWIGMASIPKDRFVSLEASFDGGTILTKPLRIEGDTLYLNAKADFGSVSVEALGADGDVLAASQPIKKDGLEIPVDWKNGWTLPKHKPVQLRITLNNARLFAFWCE